MELRRGGRGRWKGVQNGKCRVGVGESEELELEVERVKRAKLDGGEF